MDYCYRGNPVLIGANYRLTLQGCAIYLKGFSFSIILDINLKFNYRREFLKKTEELAQYVTYDDTLLCLDQNSHPQFSIFDSNKLNTR